MPFIKVDDINFFYNISARSDLNDKDKSTLIFLHGGAGMADHSIYVSFWSNFDDIVNVVFLDQRGCGRTDKGDNSKWNLKQNGNDLYNFCNAMNIEKPIVAGVSWGGYVTISYGISHPNHPLGLILCNTEAHVSPEERYKAFLKVGTLESAEAVKAFDSNWNQETNQNYFKHCLPFYAKRAYTPEELAGCIRNPDLWSKYMKEEHTKFDFRQQLSNIACPVLHLAGENDPVHPITCAKETAKLIGDNCELAIIKDTGDPVYRDKPEETIDIINTFISKLINTPVFQPKNKQSSYTIS